MKKEPKMCASVRCLQEPTQGEWCYYHAKMVAGLVDPTSAELYPKRLIQGARKRESARFKRDIAQMAAAVD